VRAANGGDGDRAAEHGERQRQSEDELFIGGSSSVATTIPVGISIGRIRSDDCGGDRATDHGEGEHKSKHERRHFITRSPIRFRDPRLFPLRVRHVFCV
jgi:hypothetical protein